MGFSFRGFYNFASFRERIEHTSGSKTSKATPCCGTMQI